MGKWRQGSQAAKKKKDKGIPKGGSPEIFQNP